MAAVMASTARAIAGISRATASATRRSSALMISRMRSADRASMPSDAGFACSVSRFSSNAGLPHHGARRFESEPGTLFRRHVLQTAAEDFHAHEILISDLLQGMKETHQVYDAFAGHEPLVIADLVRGQLGRIAQMNVDDAVFARVDDVRGGRA